MVGTPGASAKREYERRKAKRMKDARAKFGVFGAFAVRLTDEPRHARSWDRGAAGEIAAARRFAKLLAHCDVRQLHDRRVPGHGQANIDHLLIGAGGVTVVDTKALTGKVRTESRGGLFSSYPALIINGRDRTSLVTKLEAQIGYVRQALQLTEFGAISIRGALCFPDVKGLPIIAALHVRDVLIDGPKRVAKLARRPGDLSPEAVDTLWRLLADRFPVA